jgi:two-component system KDP operon response regulator KdpE
LITTPLVLVVDDEPGILRLIKLELESQDFEVLSASTGDEGWAAAVASARWPDIAVLDIMMPGRNGIELMTDLRKKAPLPVILLTAKDAEADKVAGLEAGADDYIAKPFSPDELSARVRAVLRRSTQATQQERVFRNGSLEVDLMRRLVKRDGEIVQLSRTEWMLLQHLAGNPGKIMLNGELLHRVWGPEYGDDLQYLRVWISRIRRKIEDDPSKPRLIKTFQGVGYMLVAPGETEISDSDADEEEDEITVA